MAGLLYKDFVGIKGKRVVLILTACTLLFLILRIVFPGTDGSFADGVVGENEKGELVRIAKGEVSDSFLVFVPMILMACMLFLPSIWTAAICKNDEKNKTRDFVRALPFGRNSYIASKYIFIGIGVYVLFSLENAWIIIFNGLAGSGRSSQVVSAFSVFVPSFAGMALILAAFELPFFITFGSKKGNMIKTGLLEGLFFLVMVYVFFGDLTVFENFDIIKLIEWCSSHSILVTVLSILSPVVTLFLYWSSYLLTCKINKNREAKIDG